MTKYDLSRFNPLQKTKSDMEKLEEETQKLEENAKKEKSPAEAQALATTVRHLLQEAHHTGVQEERMDQEQDGSLKKAVLLVAGISFINLMLTIQHMGLLNSLSG